MSERVILDVGDFNSYCGACGKGCLPSDVVHETPCGYDGHDGCGARFTHIRHHIGGRIMPGFDMNARLHEMRPDLTLIADDGSERPPLTLSVPQPSSDGRME